MDIQQPNWFKKDIIEEELIINRWKHKIKNGYDEWYRKIRKQATWMNDELFSNYLIFEINNIENEKDK